MDIASPMLPILEDQPDLTAYELDNTALTALVKFQKENNPRLKGKSNRDIADACGMSENTFCAILKGKNRNPRVGTLVCILRAIGGGSIDRLVGLAPHRDFAKEEAVFDATLVEALQARLDEKRQRIEELTADLAAEKSESARLRKLLLDESAQRSAYEARAVEAESRLKDKDSVVEFRTGLHTDLKLENARLRRTGVVLSVILAVILLCLIYLLWEIANPTLGNFRY